MLIKDRKYRACKSCKTRRLISNEVYGCDTCRKVLDMNQPKADYLRANVHWHERTGECDDIICCSWVCMVKALLKVKSDYFVSLPFLHYDDAPEGMRAADLFKLLRNTEAKP